jgi:alpha-D-ribose 1-methylphosphonate 5-triphosphate synthase subunit PhnH
MSDRNDSLVTVREPGFNEVFDSQAVFRALLDSMSRPGRIFQAPLVPYPASPRGFCPPVLSVLKTLCDHRVSFSVGRCDTRSEWIRYLEVNLTAQFKALENAHYVLLDGASCDPGFSILNRGSLEFPESSATALLTVMRLSVEGDNSEGPACDLVLEGPGVDGRSTLSVAGLDPAYASEREKMNRLYPLGVDLFLVDPDGRVAGIPRTTTVEVG